MIVKRFSMDQMKFDDERGTVSALFAPFFNIDKQGDVTLPGAFGKQKVVISAYGHGSWNAGADMLPVGKGAIADGEAGGVLTGLFNLETASGRDTYSTVKFLGDLQEWSYALPEIESEKSILRDLLEKHPQIQNPLGYPMDYTVRVLKKIGVNEASPVLRGAGNGTRTLSVKGIIPISREEAAESGDWDAEAAEARVLKDQGVDYYTKAYAWGTGDVGSWKFLHHVVDSEGKVGAPNLRACINGISILNGARGGAGISEEDRAEVYEHLARHIKASGNEAPELRNMDVPLLGVPLLDHIELVVVNAADAVSRIKGLSDFREAQDRHPSEGTVRRAAMLKARLSDLVAGIDGILEKHDTLMDDYNASLKAIGRAIYQ